MKLTSMYKGDKQTTSLTTLRDRHILNHIPNSGEEQTQTQAITSAQAQINLL